MSAVPLPEPDGLMYHVYLNGRRPSAWSEEQLRAYGAACAAEQRERDAKIADAWDHDKRIAAAIRASAMPAPAPEAD